MDASNSTSRIFFKWFYDDYRLTRPFGIAAWWAPEERVLFGAHSPGPLPMPDDATRLLRVFLSVFTKRMPDIIPLCPTNGGVVWGGLMSERIIHDLGEAGIAVPCHECEFVDMENTGEYSTAQGSSQPYPVLRPLAKHSSSCLPKYYYLAPVSALKRSLPPTYPYQPYFGEHDVFTQTDRCNLYCTFKVVELARKKRWTNTRMVVCEQMESQLKPDYGTLVRLKAKAPDWPPQCVKEMIALGYRL